MFGQASYLAQNFSKADLYAGAYPLAVAVALAVARVPAGSRADMAFFSMGVRGVYDKNSMLYHGRRAGMS